MRPDQELSLTLARGLEVYQSLVEIEEKCVLSLGWMVDVGGGTSREELDIPAGPIVNGQFGGIELEKFEIEKIRLITLETAQRFVEEKVNVLEVFSNNAEP